jgi:acetyl esterase/lipase
VHAAIAAAVLWFTPASAGEPASGSPDRLLTTDAAYKWTPDGSNPVLSPTGKHIAWVAGIDAETDTELCVASIADPFACTAVDRVPGTTVLSWLSADTVLATGPGFWRAVGLSGAVVGGGHLGADEWAGRGRDGRVRLVRFSKNAWEMTSIEADGADERREGTGPADLGGWLVDRRTAVPGGYLTMAKEPGVRVIWSVSDGRVRRVASEWGRFDSAYGQKWYPVSSILDRGRLLAIDGKRYDRDALVRLDLETGRRELVYHPARGVAERVIQDPTTGEALAVSERFERTRWHALAPELEADLAWLEENVVGDYYVSDLSRDLAVWLLYVWNGQGRSWQIFDRSAHTLTRAPPRWPASEAHSWRPMRAFTVSAGDGLEFPVFLTTPSPDVWGVGPYPLLVMVHGGPWEFGHEYGFDRTHQDLAALGWAVLAVDFRGSAGYGREFYAASRGALGLAANQDIYDAIDRVVADGIGEPTRIAWYGESYGGYATLQAAVTDRSHISCGISGAGPPSLRGLVPGARAAPRPGDHPEAVGVPLLLLHGQTDASVPIGDVRRFADGAADAGVPISMVEFPGMGHGFSDAANDVAYSLIKAFLGTCVDRPFDPLPASALADVQIVIRHDSAGLPGLMRP